MSDHSNHFDEHFKRVAGIKSECATANEKNRKHVLAAWKEQILEACADALFECEDIDRIIALEGTVAMIQDLNYNRREIEWLKTAANIQ